MRNLSLLVSLIVFAKQVLAASALTDSDYRQAEQQLMASTSKLVTNTVEFPQWQNNHTLSYRSLSKEGQRFFIVDAITKEKRLAFDHQKLAAALAPVSESEINDDKLPFTDLKLLANNNLSVQVNNQAFLCDLKAYLCKKDQHASKKYDNVSPDKTRAVFLREHNLWLRDLVNNTESQLTTDGSKDFAYGTNNAGWLRSKTPVVTWSPDSKKLTTFKHDGRKVGEMAVVSTQVGHPNIDVWKYPLPGDEHVFKIHRVVIDVEKKSVTPLKMAADAHRSTITDHIASRDNQLLDIDWADDGNSFAFVSSSRDHKKATLRIANANTGEVKTIFTETINSFFESGVDQISWRYLAKSNEVIWFSQRSDWGHLYLIDLNNGKVKKQITQGDWTVISLLDVNEATGQLFFTGAGREGGDPYFHYFYRVNKDGSNLTLLTPEKQHHRITLSDDGQYFLDRVSSYNNPEVSFIRDTQNGNGFVVEQMDISQLSATGWQAPTPFVVKDRNKQFDLHGLLYKPSNFDPKQSYPVINYLYPGPQSGSIRGRHFQSARYDHQAIAELGFIVVELDALGTPGRSKTFQDAYYANMGDSGIPDQVAAIKQLAQRHPWLDSSRVGIWGHSGGGFASTRALLTYPDFYRVAVSQAGNHDNRNYADEWGEKYHGLLTTAEDGSSNYDSQANQLLAEQLKGKLLISHGTTDTNVPPYNTLLVVDALIKANKDFDLLMLPNYGHGYSREHYMMRKRWDYFVTHLLKKTPPKEYQLGLLK